MDNKLDRNPIMAILDPDDADNIVLYDENDNGVEFEQIAIVPLNNIIYAILQPVEPIEGVGEDEALVFQVYEDEEKEDSLIVVTDDKIIDEVFKVYYKLMEEDENN